MPAQEMKTPHNLLKRAKELAAEGKTVTEIVGICENEGILNERTGQPFTRPSVFYWFKKCNIRIGKKRGSYLKNKALKEIYTRSLKSMGFDDEQIEKELKELL